MKLANLTYPISYNITTGARGRKGWEESVMNYDTRIYILNCIIFIHSRVTMNPKTFQHGV